MSTLKRSIGRRRASPHRRKMSCLGPDATLVCLNSLPSILFRTRCDFYKSGPLCKEFDTNIQPRNNVFALTSPGVRHRRIVTHKHRGIDLCSFQRCKAIPFPITALFFDELLMFDQQSRTWISAGKYILLYNITTRVSRGSLPPLLPNKLSHRKHAAPANVRRNTTGTGTPTERLKGDLEWQAQLRVFFLGCPQPS